jgi:8-oxo-dGTP pyrophosphatase MutT (NUDIX family)
VSARTQAGSRLAPASEALVRDLRRVLGERAPARRQAPDATAAAVLVGLFEGPRGEPHLWLVLRPQGLRTHSGQVALPGGKRDPDDADLVATALREAEEEIGLPPRAVEVLGEADDLVTGTGFVITPVIGWIGEPFEPRPNPGEVARAFAAPFATFRAAGLVEMIPIPSIRRMVQTYRIEGEIVWGATAAILSALARRVAGDQP